MSSAFWRVRRLKLQQVSQLLCALAVGICIGWLLFYARGVDHPISEDFNSR